ncbi:MAG: hypothetical protein CMJ89_19090 [Planctomycetes bacterium]|jgi:lipopolysaccharide export LptBFGC system permease protein LptF|nr:hypothetical protein [Planctomycetota bacterium]
MTLQLYVLRQLLLAVSFSALGIMLIVLPSIAVQAIHKLKGASLSMIVEYLPMVAVMLVPYLLPMAFLLGVVATFGRLAAERELVAIRMAGIHPARLSLPVILVALLLSGGTDLLLAEVCPNWKFAQRTFLRQSQEKILRDFQRGGRSEIDTEGFYLKADRVDGSSYYGVTLEFDLEEERHVVDAEEATLEVHEDLLVARLQGAQVLTENAKFESESPTFSIALDDLFPESRLDRTPAKYHPSSTLRRELAETDPTPERAHELRYQIHSRHALSMTYLLFLLLGIPTGIRLRSSTQLGAFTGAIGYAFAYYILAMRLGKELALGGSIPALVAAWSADAIFLVVGIYIFIRTLWR